MIHSVRLPHLERVRSEKVPNTILATRATTEPTELMVPMNASRWPGAIWSTSWGTRIEDSDTHTMPVMIRLTVKPVPSLTTSMTDGRRP